MSQQHVLTSIEEASKVIGKTWPLYSFVTSNPLAGYEQSSFKEAIQSAKEHLGAQIFPEASVYRQALNQGEIQREALSKLLKENGFDQAPEYYLDVMESAKSTEEVNVQHDLDRMMAKWLAAFMDEGLAEWEMPGKKEGFYQAWRKLAKYDKELGITYENVIPKNSSEALREALKDHPHDEYTNIFTYHLASMPGWTGYINYRSESNSLWQQKYPISLQDYLGVRLWIAHHWKMEIVPTKEESKVDLDSMKLQYVWLKAWEKSWQNELLNLLEKESIQENNASPDAQLVFCIDTRSELIRRHIESKGSYETFGYAGFFGIAMDYKSIEDGQIRKSCPPIVASAYQVSEVPQAKKEQSFQRFERRNKQLKFGKYFLKRMKNMLPSAFGFVEGSGFFYGLILMARTISPRYLYRIKQKYATSHETFCEPELQHIAKHKSETLDIPLIEKVAIVKSAFDLLGWSQFARLVLFVGHGSHTANNPFGSSLDCGACAASPGRHNARMLASLANEPEVRKSLQEDHDIVIPESTIFIGGEHNTTTDDIVLFDSEVPYSHREDLRKLKADLKLAQGTATQDRLQVKNNSIEKAEEKANYWGETRPEWGLAKNAGFIVGPRALTKNKNLESKCFLHSYDWKQDSTGKALEGIMQGPMVVTQWINNHYYFSTVDNSTFGGGSKITHNITGKFGVVQGNGGDLKMGLPLESIKKSDDEMYHAPLRLSVLIQAPLARIEEILSRNENLQKLLDNEWIYLMVMDPLNENEIKRYSRGLEWIQSTAQKKVGAVGAKKVKEVILEEVFA